MTDAKWIVLGGLAVLLMMWGSYVVGRGRAEDRLAAQVAESKVVTDSLTADLKHAIAWVKTDTVRVDSLIVRWRTAAAARVAPETLPGRVDTLWRDQLVQAGTVAIEAADQQRRACLRILGDCELVVDSANARANREAALRRTAELASQRRRTYHAVERGVCAASLATTVLMWRRK